MLKILHVTGSYLPRIDGSSLRLKRLIEPIAHECEFHILVPKRNIFGEPIYENEVPDFEVINRINVHRVLKVSQMRGAIRRLCQSYKIDLIHAHNPRFAFISLLALSHRPLLFELRAPTELTRIKAAVAHWVYHHVDHLVVLSQSMKGYLIRQHRVPEEKITVIYNGVDAQKFQVSDEQRAMVRSDYDPNDEYKVVGYIGSFYEWQGVIDLVRAFSVVVRRCKHARLLMVGDGPDRPMVQEAIKEFGLESEVILTGRIPPQKVPAYLAAMDVFVIPRPSTIGTETAIPLKLLEAMAAGVPIVATQVGGLTEVLEDGTDALLCPPGRNDLLAKNILLLLDDQDLRSKISINARQKVISWFNWEYLSRQLLQLYERMLSKEHSAP